MHGRGKDQMGIGIIRGLCYICCTANMEKNVNDPNASQILDEAAAAIAGLPGVNVASSEDDVSIGDHRFDRVLNAEVKGKPVSLVIEARASAYPRDVRHAADQLALVNGHSPSLRRVPMFVAPSISQSSRALLKSKGIAFWDTGGSLFLELPWALYWIDRPVPPGGERRLRSIFRGRNGQVLHAMLLDPHRQWHIRDLADVARASPATVHKVLVALEERGWVEKEGAGPQVIRVLCNPGALLDAWAAEHTLDAYTPRRFHRWARRSDDLLAPVSSALDVVGIDYALTLASGAQLVAPFTTGVSRLTILVPNLSKLDEAARLAELKQVDEGENVIFLQTPIHTPLLFRQRISHAWIASDVQLYLDLWASAQRGKEQARHLRHERLDY